MSLHGIFDWFCVYSYVVKMFTLPNKRSKPKKRKGQKNPSPLSAFVTGEFSPLVTGEFSPDTTGEFVYALKAAREKGSTSPLALQLGPSVVSPLATVVMLLRWGALLTGMAWLMQDVSTSDQPSIGPRFIATLAVAVFVTSWRTIQPLKLGHPGRWVVAQSIADVAVLALAVGLNDGEGGLLSPFVGCLYVAVAAAAFGWGLRPGLTAAAVAFFVASTTHYILGAVLDEGVGWGIEDLAGSFNLAQPFPLMALAAVAILPGVALDRLIEMEERRRVVAFQRDRLAETNQLLEALNELARSLPSSLDLSDVLKATRMQLMSTFKASRIVLLSFEDDKWSPLLQEGFSIRPELTTRELPSALSQAAGASDLQLLPDLAPFGSSGSGMYSRLVVDGVDTGLVAIEHTETSFYNKSDVDLLRGMSDVLALTLANARSFRRLRSLAAAEERTRIARDLHDRLGQYLTYIALELERINNAKATPSPELTDLHKDVQGAIGEFRDTLIELRASVTPERPLSVVLGEVVSRFRKRSALEIDLVVPTTAVRLPSLVENELLRIAQEALTNIEKHAAATRVHLAWSVEGGRGVLVIQDNGRGFDTGKGIRGNAYGLVGMKERAAAIGAVLEIASRPGAGTAITIQTIQPTYR